MGRRDSKDIEGTLAELNAAEVPLRERRDSTGSNISTESFPDDEETQIETIRRQKTFVRFLSFLDARGSTLRNSIAALRGSIFKPGQRLPRTQSDTSLNSNKNSIKEGKWDYEESKKKWQFWKRSNKVAPSG